MKYLTLITVLLITFATKSMSGETIMVCDAHDDVSRYYKLVTRCLENPLLNKNWIVGGVVFLEEGKGCRR